MAANARIYAIRFENVTVAAVQDLFYLKASSTNGIALRRASLSAGGVTSAAEIRVGLKRLPTTVTVGSGGTAPTIQKVGSSNPTAALSAARANDTTQATTNGTAVNLAAWQWNVLGEFVEVPPSLEERWECAASEALVLEVLASPASTTVSGFLVFEET